MYCIPYNNNYYYINAYLHNCIHVSHLTFVERLTYSTYVYSRSNSNRLNVRTLFMLCACCFVVNFYINPFDWCFYLAHGICFDFIPILCPLCSAFTCVLSSTYLHNNTIDVRYIHSILMLVCITRDTNCYGNVSAARYMLQHYLPNSYVKNSNAMKKDRMLKFLQ